jgi:hypothetical protein
VAAARSALGSAGAYTAAAVVIGNCVWIPDIASSPNWNPHFGQFWFLAAISCGIAVLLRREQWWPALVLTASVATQAHLMFALPAAVLCGVGLVFVVAAVRSERLAPGWLAAGLVVGAVCWAAPLYQAAAGSQSNMRILLSHGSNARSMGVGQGLKSVALAIVGHPLWTQNINRNLFLTDTQIIKHGDPVIGLVGAAAIVALLPLAWWLRSRLLAVLAAVDLILLLGVIVEFANTPRQAFFSVPYLIQTLYPAGVLAWLASAVALGLVAVKLVRPRPNDVIARFQRHGALVLAVMLSLGGLAFSIERLAPVVVHGTVGFPAVKRSCALIRHRIPPGPVYISVLGVNGRPFSEGGFDVALCLLTNGYEPQLEPRFAQELGPQFSATPHTPEAIVRIYAKPVTVTFLKR